jgi:EAL and modified HD-GYP domain-containing signal transduction protein
MITTHNEVDQVLRLNEFFLARQPILNRDQSLAAYELLFRGAALGGANVTDDLSATAAVIAHASELGLTNVIGNTLGFVNVDAAVLMSDFVSFLPSNHVVLEILETVKVTNTIVDRVAELARAGYTFALDDVIADSPDLQRLMPWVSIIKIDITGMEREDLSRLSAQFGGNKKKLLAEKVETIEQFNICLDLDFHYFQGYYFAKPVVMSGKKLSPSQLAIVRLMAQIVSDADTADIERSIKQDAALGLMLLRLVNTPAIGAGQRIDSLGQALIVLGRRQLQRWLQILLYAEPGKKTAHSLSPLLLLATTRGKLLELIAQKLHPGNRNIADIAFTVGIMSLMDTLFGSPMEKILEQIAVVDEVSNALLYRNGLYGDMLKLAEYMERLEEADPLLIPTLQKLQLSSEELNAMQLAAFEWSDNVTRNAG